jgi:hypothetical protein
MRGSMLIELYERLAYDAPLRARAGAQPQCRTAWVQDRVPARVSAVRRAAIDVSTEPYVDLAREALADGGSRVPSMGSESPSLRSWEVQLMTFVEKPRFGGGRTEQVKMSWEGEIFGVGLFEALAEMYPEHADEATACARMEWFNIHRCEDFGHHGGVHVSLEQAEKLGREGADLARKHSFEAWRSSRSRRLLRPTRCTSSWARARARPS